MGRQKGRIRCSDKADKTYIMSGRKKKGKSKFPLATRLEPLIGDNKRLRQYLFFIGIKE